MASEGVSGGRVYLKSCIFFNFFDQIKLGANASSFIERCHMSEAKNISLSAINPCAFKVVGCNFSKPGRHGILCEWLQESSQTETCRRIAIEGCEFNQTGSASISIQPSHRGQMKACAHNLIIEVLRNKISRSKSEGMTVLNMVLTKMNIQGNEFSFNQLHNLYIKQVHQKSNKCASAAITYLGMRDNRFW